MRAFICKSIQRKFVAIMLLVLIAVTGPLLAIFGLVSSHSIEREVRAKKEALLDANSSALSKPLWDFDFANLNRWAETIALDPDVAVVEIYNDRDDLVASAPENRVEVENRLSGEIDEQRREIIHKANGETVPVGLLRIVYHGDRMANQVWREVGKSALLFIFSTIAVLATAIVANKFIIARPLSMLTSAIEATGRLSKRHHVSFASNDELGKVIHNFNDMQDRLDEDEEKLRDAHERVSFLYNNTPAMLYSVNSEDVIVWVSDYWLRATGYTADEVVGQLFGSFVTEETLADYTGRTGVNDMPHGETGEAYCVFRRKDGDHINVLISETADLHISDGLTRTLSVMTNITDLKTAEAALLKQAQTDSLTGLANREGFSIQTERAIAEAADAGAPLCMLFFDLDHFKWINDNLGHETGDQVLETIAARIRPLLQPGDLFARLGGDEFSVMLTGRDLKTRAITLANQIRDCLHAPFKIEGRRLSVNVSVGISFYPDNALTADELLRTADVAMYQKKRSGRGGYCLFNKEMGRIASRHLEVQQHIIDGLALDWFDLHFQPIIDLKTQKTVGFEGLLRLNHPTEGRIYPDEVIRVAEDNGLILDIGDRALNLGLNQLSRLARDPMHEDAYVAINLSAAQFLPGLPAKLASQLMRHKIRPDRLVLEITETVLMQDNPELEHIFNEIRALGCRFALDDFGTGYSSLSYLNRFPVDIVKIDRAFTQSLDGTEHRDVTERTRFLIQGIRILARQLGVTLIAEGVETEAQYRGLMDMNIDAGQGYYFGRPEESGYYLAGGQSVDTALRIGT